MNEFWIRVISIICITTCFLLSPILFPGATEISEKLMYALFAITGAGVGIPIAKAGINKIRGKE